MIDLLKRMITRRHITLLLTLILAGCIEPIEPELGVFDYLMVVEGHVSNLDEANTVRLSRTKPLSVEYGGVEVGALVYVEDQEGAKFYFEETSPGIYQSDPACFIGETGNSYALYIETLYGETYQSKPILLNAAPDIDSLYFEREQRLTNEGITKDFSTLMTLKDSRNTSAMNGKRPIKSKFPTHRISVCGFATTPRQTPIFLRQTPVSSKSQESANLK